MILVHRVTRDKRVKLVQPVVQVVMVQKVRRDKKELLVAQVIQAQLDKKVQLVLLEQVLQCKVVLQLQATYHHLQHHLKVMPI